MFALHWPPKQSSNGSQNGNMVPFRDHKIVVFRFPANQPEKGTLETTLPPNNKILMGESGHPQARPGPDGVMGSDFLSSEKGAWAPWASWMENPLDRLLIDGARVSAACSNLQRGQAIGFGQVIDPTCGLQPFLLSPSSVNYPWSLNLKPWGCLRYSGIGLAGSLRFANEKPASFTQGIL